MIIIITIILVIKVFIDRKILSVGSILSGYTTNTSVIIIITWSSLCRLTTVKSR